MDYPDEFDAPLIAPDSCDHELETDRIERDAVKMLRTVHPSLRESMIDSFPGSKKKKQLIRLNWDKDQGNDLFRQNKYGTAILKYKEAIRHVLSFDPPIHDATCERYRNLALVRIETCQ